MTSAYIYWSATGLLSLLYLSSAYLYVAKAAWVRETLRQLGYPTYLVPVLAIVKVVGVATILWRFEVAISDLAYAGIFYHLLLSGVAHLGGRSPKGAVPAMIGLVLLATSFATQNRARAVPSPYAPAVTDR